jgi:hypothetical protein
MSLMSTLVFPVLAVVITGQLYDDAANNELRGAPPAGSSILKGVKVTDQPVGPQQARSDGQQVEQSIASMNKPCTERLAIERSTDTKALMGSMRESIDSGMLKIKSDHFLETTQEHEPSLSAIKKPIIEATDQKIKHTGAKTRQL